MSVTSMNRRALLAAGAAATFVAANPNCTMCPVKSSCPIQPEGRTL